jgi:hypothetical protein
MATPILITHDGKKIKLPPDVYKQFQKILQEREHKSPRARRIAHIDATYGKYAGKKSLTVALLKERKEELAREESKLRKRHG